MKAVILANTEKVAMARGLEIPSCFLPLHTEMTVIERQISLLNINGFARDSIHVVFGVGGTWERRHVKDLIQAIDAEKHYAPCGTVPASVLKFLKGDDALFIDGDCYFDIAIIARLLRFERKNALVTNKSLRPCYSDSNSVLVRDDGAVSFAKSDSFAFPWTVYSGICKLSKEAVSAIGQNGQDSLMCRLKFLASRYPLFSIDYDDLVYGVINGGYSAQLTGGSYSKLNYRLVVKKEDDADGKEKLINEIKWLQSLPSELKPYFSEVLEYGISNDHVFYNVPYYGKRNLREHIMMGKFNADDTIAFLKRLLTWLFANVYSRKISDETDGWVLEKHINRVLTRLPLCAQKSEKMASVINAKKIRLNGVEYLNVKELFARLTKMDDLLERLRPKELDMIHGDLHFQNILLYPQNDTGFILVDPRGESMGSDVYYDMGKLFHSFHGKYDFIHSDQFRLQMNAEDSAVVASLDITNRYVYDIYESIYRKFLALMPEFDFFAKDPDYLMKAYFAEAADFCSVSVFHIGKTSDQNRAVALYLIGVKLINEFFNRYVY